MFACGTREAVLEVVRCSVVIQAITHTTSHTPLLKRAGRQHEGSGTTERHVDAAQNKVTTRTMREAAQTKPVLLAAYAFAAALEAVPADDWCRTWGDSLDSRTPAVIDSGVLLPSAVSSTMTRTVYQRTSRQAFSPLLDVAAPASQRVAEMANIAYLLVPHQHRNAGTVPSAGTP